MTEKHKLSFFDKVKIIFAPENDKGISLYNRVRISIFDDWNKYRNADITKPEDKEIFDILNKSAKNLGVSAPNLVIFNSRFPSVGKDIFSDTIIINNGAIDSLNSKELEAVLSHELVHKKHGIRDTLSNLLLFLASVGSTVFFFKKKVNIEPTFFSQHIKEPLVAVAAFFVSERVFYRAREFEADREGSVASGKPMELAEGLQKLYDGQNALYEKYKVNNNNTFVDTLSEIPPPSVKNFIKEIISSHPPMEERVARLKAMDAANKAAELQSQR